MKKDTILIWVEIYEVHGIDGLTSTGKQLQGFDTSFKLRKIQSTINVFYALCERIIYFVMPPNSKQHVITATPEQ